MTAHPWQFHDCTCGVAEGEPHDMDCMALEPKQTMTGYLTCFSLHPGEKMVRVSAELVEQLKAAPSQPVTLQIEEREGDELQFILTRHDCPNDAAPNAPPPPPAPPPPRELR